MRVAIFSPKNSFSYPLAEYYLYKILEKKFEIDLIIFEDDIRINKYKNLNKESLKIKTKYQYFWHKKYLKNLIPKYDLIITRPIGGYKATDISKIIYQNKIKIIIYSLNTVGAFYGSLVPDIYISPGIHWTKLAKKNINFLTGLKKYQFPFYKKNKSSNKIKKIITLGSVSSLEIDRKLLLKKRKKKREKFITFCLDSSPKYINEDGTFKKFLYFTIGMLKEIKERTDYKIILKPHPFQISKPFKNYKRKQLNLSIFDNYVYRIQIDNDLKYIIESKYIIVNNSSVVYEMAYLKKTCLVVAENISDLKSKNALFEGGFLTPEIPGKIIFGYENLIKFLEKDFEYKKFQSYVKNYHQRFNQIKFTKILEDFMDEL